MIYDNETFRASAAALAEPEGEGTPPETPVLLVYLDEGGPAAVRYAVPLTFATEQDEAKGWTLGEPMMPFTAVAGRPFVRTVDGSIVAVEHIVRIEGMP